MNGKLQPSFLVIATLLFATFAPLSAGQTAGDGGAATSTGFDINGEWPAVEDRGDAKAVRKILGAFTTTDGRLKGAGFAFATGTCGADGACFLNVSSGGSAPAALADIRFLGGDARISLGSATARLDATGATGLLAAAPPGVGVFTATNDSTVRFTLAPGTNVHASPGGVVRFTNGDASITLKASGTNAVTMAAGAVDVGLDATSRAFLFGSFEKGLGAIPAANATALVADDRLAGFMVGVRGDGVPHASLVDLAATTADLAFTDGALTWNLDVPSADGGLAVAVMPKGFLAEGASAMDFAVLLDGKPAPRVESAIKLWDGTKPVAGTAFVDAKAEHVVVAVPAGTHTVSFLQAPAAPKMALAGLDEIRPGGKLSNALVGAFDNGVAADRLEGRYLELSVSARGDGTDLVDVSYPGKATPLFANIHIPGASSSLARAGSVASLAGGASTVTFYDAPSAWTLLEFNGERRVTFTPGDGVTLRVGTDELVATLNDFHAHVVPWPGDPAVARAREPWTTEYDFATNTATVTFQAGDRALIAAHPDVGGNVNEFHALLSLIRSGSFVGAYETDFDEDLGEFAHFMGFGAAPEMPRYGDGVAQTRVQGQQGQVAVFDFSPKFFDPFKPRSFTVNLDGGRVSFAPNRATDGTAIDVFDAQELRDKRGVMVMNGDQVRVVLYLPDNEPHTVTVLQDSAVVPDDPGQRFLGLLVVLTILGSVGAWYVRYRWEPS